MQDTSNIHWQHPLCLQRHLIPGLLREHGLGQDQLEFPPEALQLIADGYTREVSHVRCCSAAYLHKAP